MYKTPELSTMAKLLHTELAAKGFELTYAQALEMVAKTCGNRNLHAAQAKAQNNKGVDLQVFAEQEAARQMFSQLGCYKGRVRELMQAIVAACACSDSRTAEAAIHALTVTAGVRLSQEMAPYRWDELQGVFSRKVAQIKRLAFELQRSPVQVDGQGREVLWQGPMRDWMVDDGADADELSARQTREFEAVVTRSGSQLVIDISLPHLSPDDFAGSDSLSLFVEVNQGVPCVHLTNDMYGEQVLTAFGLSDGLYLRPDRSHASIRTGMPPEGTGLQDFVQEERKHSGPPSQNDAFILAPNKV